MFPDVSHPEDPLVVWDGPVENSSSAHDLTTGHKTRRTSQGLMKKTSGANGGWKKTGDFCRYKWYMFVAFFLPIG